MARKKANEATIAPPPVSDSSVPVNKKSRAKASASVAAVKETKPKTVTVRRRTAPKSAVETQNVSIANLAEAVETPAAVTVEIDIHAIEERAYQSWLERGCPMGSPDEDWYRAERELIASTK